MSLHDEVPPEVLAEVLKPPKVPKPEPKTYIDRRSWWLQNQKDSHYFGPTTPDGITIIKLQYKKDKDGNHIYYLYNGLIKEKLSTYLPITEEEKAHEKDYELPPYEYELEKWKLVHIIDPTKEIYASVYSAIKLINYRFTTVISNKEYRPEFTKNQYMIGGSFALDKYLQMSGESTKDSWNYHDVDYFFLGTSSQTRFRIRNCLLHHILPGNYTSNGWLIKYGGMSINNIPPMDFVRTECQTMKELIDCIDISITGVFIVHQTMIDDEHVKVIGEVKELSSGEDKYFLVATPKAIEDIKEKRQTYYRSVEDSSYGRCLERVAKYWKRGFKTIVHEPKKLPHAVGSYL